MFIYLYNKKITKLYLFLNKEKYGYTLGTMINVHDMCTNNN